MLIATESIDGVFQTVVNVILDQGAFGLANRLFDGMELLGYIHTGSAIFNHGDDAAKMAFGSF